MRGYEAHSINKKSFNCPVCQAHTGQEWYKVFAEMLKKDELPFIIRAEDIAEIIENAENSEKTTELEIEDVKRVLNPIAKSAKKGLPNLSISSETRYNIHELSNISFSKCHVCGEISVWVFDKLVWPISTHEIARPEDLPAEAEAIFNEAASIIDLSPRAAAALLRLCVQIICKTICTELGVYKERMNIDDMIQIMHKHGLSRRLQDALDIIRVKGNEAAHEIVLTDTKETAMLLFGVINTICIQMITAVRIEKELYESLPSKDKAAIEKKRPKNNSPFSAD